MHIIKSLKNKSITILLSVLIAASLLFGAVVAVIAPARADEVDDTKEFVTASLGLNNTQFGESSGNYPATPTSWTGEYVDGGKGELVKGVVDLTPSVYSTNGNKKYKLDQYDEYKSETDIPKTIFGEDTEFGGDKKALLINTASKSVSTAYAYKSGDMTLAANSFYRFSVWAKTGDFAGQSGATIKLSGLGQNFAFNNINTVRNNYNDKGEPVLDASNNYGWVKYSLYVRTSASLSKTVQINLGLGDAVKGDDEDPDVTVRPASGYVFFDNVQAERISAYDFASETLQFEKLEGKENIYGRGNALAIDLNETKSFTTKNGKEIGTFSQNVDEWNTHIYYDVPDENLSHVSSAHSGVYNSQGRVDTESNTYGFSKNPWSPYGRAEYDILNKQSPFFAGDRLANIWLINTYDGSEFTETASGIASPFVTIERFKYYRFSVWVKGDNVNGGNGISVLLKGKQIVNGKPAEYAKLLTSYTNLEGDSEDNAHYGWKEQVVYIHGSMLHDYDISFELWLGSPDSQSSGIAMFDNVTFTELKYSDYTAMSEADGGNIFAIDDLDDTSNITNGTFLNVGDMDEIKFPMPVAEWSYLTPDNVNTRGFAKDEVDTETAIHGIIPTDAETFNKILSSGAIPNVDRPTDNDLNNVLLLSSTTKTAFCYQSPSITLATDQANKITVDMRVGRIDGYGASLVLKTTDGVVLSTIENITNTNNKFRAFTFYLAAPLSEQTVYVEVWLGMNDRTNNKSKLASGNVYVKQVSLNSWTAAEGSTVDAEFKAMLEQYKYDIAHESTLKSLDYGVYSFAAPTLDYYDVYSYASGDGYGVPYQWNVTSANQNVKSGVFNADYKNGVEIYPGFSSKDLTGSMLYIFNTEKNSTKYTYDNSIALVANKYYRIDIQVKVRVTDEIRKDKTSVGAGLALTGSTAAFTNIKDTTTIADVTNEDSRDYETFQTYSFYISTGDNGGNIGLDITFGGDTKESYIQGRLVIGGIEMTEIDNLDYEAAQKSTDKKVIAVELSETNTDSDNTNTEAASSDIQWWIIPTVVVSVAMVAAILVIAIVRIVDHVKSKRKVTYSTEYDRSDVYDEIERLRAQKENAEKDAAVNNENAEPSYEETPVASNTEESETEAETLAEEAADAKAEEPTEQKPAETKNSDDDLDD
ncbi:MAG: hypothetical protein K2O04_01585 [Clostridiales bacterium]|nr:hypothetical protein [Clostridiales bacterium]